MPRRLPALLLALALAGLLALLGCGDDGGSAEGEITGDTLTIYSSLPQEGPLARVSRDLIRAEKLALNEAKGRAGAFRVSYVSLDSADPETGQWTPGTVAANARKAIQDRQTIAYLGELEWGASAISVPILNEAGMLQVSPRDTFGGLTARGGRGEPEKYYPSGRRTFARLVPGDDEQARELTDLMRARDVRRLVLADDRGVSGSSLADRLVPRLRAAGITVVERERLDPRDEVPDDVARDVREERADAFLYAGSTGEFAGDVLRSVGTDAPEVQLFGPDELSLTAPPEGAPRRLVVTGVATPSDPRTRAFRRRFLAAYGAEPDRQAIFGYEAMRLVLGAIARAGEAAGQRRIVIREALRAVNEPKAEFRPFRIVDKELRPAGRTG